MLRAVSPRRLEVLALGALLLVTLVLKLAYLENWLYNNDNYITLSTFFRSADQPLYREAAHRFYRVSLDACEPGDVRCVALAGAVHWDLTFARPIVAFFGSRIARPENLASAAAFLHAVTRATVGQVATAWAASWLLLLPFLLGLPRCVRTFVAGATALFGLAVFDLFRPGAWVDFQPILGVGYAAALGIVALAGAASAWAQGAVSGGPLALEERFPGRADALLWAAALGLLLVRTGAVRSERPFLGGNVLGAGVGVVPVLVLFAGIAVFLAAVGVAARREGMRAALVWIGVLLLFGFVSKDEAFFVTGFHIAARGAVCLLAAPILLYAAFRPNGALLWLVPLTGIFHVAIAGLLGGCMLAVECVCGLRRRRASLAMGMGALTLAGALVHTALTSGNGAGATSAHSPAALLSAGVLIALVPGVAVAAILAWAGRLAWRMPDPTGDLLLRALVLAGMLVAAGQLRQAILAAGYHPLDPKLFMFAMLPSYLSTLVCVPGIFLVLVAMGASGRAGAAAPAGGVRLQRATMGVLAAGVLALGAARGNNDATVPRNPFAAVARGARTLLTGRAPRPREPGVVAAASPDDHYYVGPSPGDEITVTSILKLKARARAGLLRLDDLRIDVVKRREDD